MFWLLGTTALMCIFLNFHRASSIHIYLNNFKVCEPIFSNNSLKVGITDHYFEEENAF